MKYFKWVFKKSINDKEKPLKIDEVVVCDMWDPDNKDWDKRGGFNFSNEESILRWISRGDTLCEVIVPKGAEIKNIINQKTPNGIIIANKIILKNPIPASDELAMKLYKKSNMPLKTYFETIAALAIRGCYNTALQIIKDKVNMDNIDEALYEYKNFLRPWHKNNMNKEVYDKVLEVLNEIKSDTLINLFIDKEPYIKELTNDRIINLTGQTGSGKSTYAKKIFNSNEYLIIDTDEIFSEHRFKETKGINKELGEYFREKYKELPNCSDDFDLIYKDILDYCKNYNKTIVIDCAQFHCIKDINLLKGKMIIIRTSIDNCFNRAVNRYKNNNPNYTKEEFEKYLEKKKRIYKWYKISNAFIEKIDSKYSYNNFKKR